MFHAIICIPKSHSAHSIHLRIPNPLDYTKFRRLETSKFTALPMNYVSRLQFYQDFVF
jgi:hypothetical protein